MAGKNLGPLPLHGTLAGKHLAVIGGTGFLGKVFWVMLLSKFPELGKLHLVVRARKGQDAETRFWEEIAPGHCLDTLREQHGSNFEAFLRQKVEVVEGDIVQPYCGISPQVREAWRGKVDALINASGIVNFQPPLDIALEVNAFGVQSLVALAKDIGGVPLMHTSTCYVAGFQTGIVEEASPLDHPFPHAGKLERAHWDADREIDECLDIIRQARHRAGDAFRQSHFLDQAKQNLLERGEPVRGKVLESEIEKVRRKFVEAQLAELGQERATFWGWANTYTYTKSIGEQIAARSGLPFTIVRPAIIESCVKYPQQGWNEGINTSAPLIFAIRQGQFQLPGAEIPLDIIPCDMVATGMILALAELLRGEHKPVYQFGTSDSNPTTMARVFELSGLYKRKYYRNTGKGGPLAAFVQGHFEGTLMAPTSFDRFGPRQLAQGARGLANIIDKASSGPVGSMFKPTVKNLERFAKTQLKLYDIVKQFEPFVATFDYEFRCDNTRSAWARVSDAERDKLLWEPEKLDWRDWFLNTHMPGLERWVFPEMEQRLRKPVRSLQRFESLPDLLSQMAERYGLATALSRTEEDGLSRVSFEQWHDRARACASRLIALGVRRGDRVLLVAKNHPDWAIALFGIACAGATAVPLDADVDAQTTAVLLQASRSVVALVDERAAERLADTLGSVRVLALSSATALGAINSMPEVSTDDIALLIYTSGTTGKPKGVMLSHANLCSLLASLAPLFPLRNDDRMLSVLPLHHTFELTCGLLLPLSRGSRVVYLDELNAERLAHAMKAARITAMAGVPALWEMLERKILSRVSEHGPLAMQAFDVALEVSRTVGKATGIDLGRLLFGSVHQQLGGHLRFLVSGGAALGESTHSLFSGLGLPLTEGYGLTEAAPVLSVATAGPRSKAKQVGRAIPDVEIRIDAPNADGIGEVVARGPNVMVGYSDDPEATRQVLDANGWLRTGDLGKLDHRGRLSIVGRAKDVIVASNGENVYPDDVEARLGKPTGIAELAVIGISADKGGERVACAAVVEPVPGQSRAEAHNRARKALEEAIARLPMAMRPAVITLLDNKLPRTSTRKVKRKELQLLIERLQAGASATGDGQATVVRQVLAKLLRRDAKTIAAEMTLRGDLGCDSLMLMDVLVALEAHAGRVIDAERLATCQNVGDVEAFMQEILQRPIAASVESDEATSLEVPEALRKPAMEWMGKVQMGFYDQFMRTKVTGRAFIPQNRNVLVVANHASHLDMGLVKFALGDYSKDMVSLAAQDYFFEGNVRKAFFENFSNLVPISRTGSLRQLLRTAGDLLERGKVVLLFPEGTRSPDGSLQEFKPALGHIALHTKVDILPIWLEGTYRALPKGATLVRDRRLEARIGPPLSFEGLRSRTEGMSSREATRAVTEIIQRAVESLSLGEPFSLADEPIVAPSPPVSVSSQPVVPVAKPAEPRRNGAPVVSSVASGGAEAAKVGVEANGKHRVANGTPALAPSRRASNGLEGLFDQLQSQFVPGTTTKPLSYYFSLGNEKWTLKASSDTCEVQRGKAVDSADCVLKTSPEMFKRIVQEAYTPSRLEFLSGRVKSNNVQLLLTFQKMFNLDSRPARRQ